MIPRAIWSTLKKECVSPRADKGEETKEVKEKKILPEKETKTSIPLRKEKHISAKSENLSSTTSAKEDKSTEENSNVKYGKHSKDISVSDNSSKLHHGGGKPQIDTLTNLDEEDARRRGMSVEEWLKDKKEKSVKEWLEKSVDPGEGTKKKWVHSLEVNENPERVAKTSDELIEDIFASLKNGDKKLNSGALSDEEVIDVSSGDSSDEKKDSSDDEKKRKKKKYKGTERETEREGYRDRQKIREWDIGKVFDEEADSDKGKVREKDRFKKIDRDNQRNKENSRDNEKYKSNSRSKDKNRETKREGNRVHSSKIENERCKDKKKKKKKRNYETDDDYEKKDKRKKKKKSDDSDNEDQLREAALKSRKSDLKSEEVKSSHCVVKSVEEETAAKEAAPDSTDVKCYNPAIAKFVEASAPNTYNANISLPTEKEIKEKSDQLLDDLFTYIDEEKKKKEERERAEQKKLDEDKKASKRKSSSRDAKEKEKRRSSSRSRRNSPSSKSKKRSRSRKRTTRSRSRKRRSSSKSKRSSDKKSSRRRSRSRSDRRRSDRTRSPSGHRGRSLSRSSSDRFSSPRRRSRSQELIEAADKFERSKRGRLKMKQHLIDQAKLLKIAKEQVQGTQDTLRALSVQCMEIARKGLEETAKAEANPDPEEEESEEEEETKEVILNVYATPSMMRISKSNANYKAVLNSELEKYGQLGTVTGFWMTPLGYDKAYEKTIGDGMGGKKKVAYRPTGSSLLAIGMEGHADYQKVYLPTTIKIDTKWPEKWEKKGLIKTIFARASLFGDINIQDTNPHGKMHPKSAFPSAVGTAPLSMQESSTALVVFNPDFEPKGPYNPFSKEAKEWEKQKRRQALLSALLPGGSSHPDSKRLEIEDHHVPFNPFSKEAKEAERLKKLEEKEAKKKDKGKEKKGKGKGGAGKDEILETEEGTKKKGSKPPQFNPFLEGFRPSSYGYGEVRWTDEGPLDVSRLGAKFNPSQTTKYKLAVMASMEVGEVWSDRVVLPGEPVTLPEEGDTVVVGPGLRREAGSEVRVTKAGVMRRRLPGPVYWVDCHSKRYVANRGENVIGVVVAKAGDTFRVDIGTAEPASLSYLAFEGATKKNRPAVVVGDVVYAKLLVASRDMESELVCVDSYGKKAGLGVLSGSGGLLFSVPLHLVRKLLSPQSGLLSSLGTAIPFEVAVGMNGRVWVRARSVRETVGLAQAIECAEHMDRAQVDTMVARLTGVLQGF